LSAVTKLVCKKGFWYIKFKFYFKSNKLTFKAIWTLGKSYIFYKYQINQLKYSYIYTAYQNKLNQNSKFIPIK